MKKLNSLFFLLIGILCFTSCGDDDYTYKAPETLSVTKADLYFKSAGGTGSIEINTDRELKATTSVDWCTAKIVGGKVTVTALENEAIESRAGTVTVSDGALSSLIAVYQEGLACVINTSGLNSSANNSAGSGVITIDSSSPYTITISQNAALWLNYTKDDTGKKVTFTYSANTSGAPRGAAITVVSGSKKVIIPFTQYEIQDIAGKWTAKYLIGDDEGTVGSEEIMITKVSESMLDLTFNAPDPNSPTTIPVFHCSYSKGVLSIPNGASQGRYSSYYLNTLFLSSDGYVSWSNTYTYIGSGAVTENGDFYIKFKDTGTWPDKVISGVAIGAFSKPTPASDSFIGTLAVYDNLALYR